MQISRIVIRCYLPKHLEKFFFVHWKYLHSFRSILLLLLYNIIIPFYFVLVIRSLSSKYSFQLQVKQLNVNCHIQNQKRILYLLMWICCYHTWNSKVSLNQYLLQWNRLRHLNGNSDYSSWLFNHDHQLLKIHSHGHLLELCLQISWFSCL